MNEIKAISLQASVTICYLIRNDMKLLYAAQLRGARNQKKSRIGGPGEVHFIVAAALIMQVKLEARYLTLSPFFVY